MNRQWNWKAQREKRAFLALEDGSVYRGHPVGAPVDTVGEVVFNTGMTGYQEILTDPSYNGQIVVMTYTEIGNTGVNPQDVESRRPFVNGFVVHEINQPSNWRCAHPLDEYLREWKIPAIAGIDTRALTTRLRDRGTMKGFISCTGRVGEEEALRRAREWIGLDNQDYTARVTIDSPKRWNTDDTLSSSWGIVDALPPTDLRVVAYDYGLKWNILRRLREQGMDVKIVPAQTPAEEVLKMKPDGVFLSNGPADPAAITHAIINIQKLTGKTPIMGICLGHQLIGLALGGRTFRLKFGHHGCNHPVRNNETGAVEITSQNHNFAVDPDTLDAALVEITHTSLNDGTVEGLRHRKEPLFCVQYHPESSPGPHDSSYHFRRFRQLIQEA